MLISPEKAAEEVKCFEDLRSIITNLNEKLEGNEEVEGISRELLKLDEEMNLMEKVKHIQRELNVILKVLKDQIRVIEQMIELFTDGPLKYPQVGNVAELAEKRRKKLIKREEQIAALNLRAKHTFTDVGNAHRNGSLWFC
jgi:Mg2+ and Co2+ transporter CorA